MMEMAELQSYVLLVLVGFLPNETWRMLGLAAARGVNEESELFLLARAIATAVLAGVIAKIVVFPPGALAAVPLQIRLGAARFTCGMTGSGWLGLNLVNAVLALVTLGLGAPWIIVTSSFRVRRSYTRASPAGPAVSTRRPSRL